MTADQYDAKLAEQGTVCAMCAAPCTEETPLHVDHDHESGAVRDLICQHCNIAVGYAEKCFDRMARAMIYLEKHKDEEGSP